MLIQIGEILKIVNKELKKNKKKCVTSETLNTKLEIDSLSFIKIIVDCEKKFKVQFPDEYLVVNRLDTVTKLYDTINLIKKKR